MRPLNICIVDDEDVLRIPLADDLSDAGFSIREFDNPLEALQDLQKQPADVVITDIKMSQMDGIALLEKVKADAPETAVIVMTAYSSVDSAVEAMKKGAYDYIAKPFQIDEMLLLLQRIAELRAVKSENRYLRSQIITQYLPDAFVGNSPAVQQTLELVKTVATTDTTVLITGETGTGKELLANVLHYNSNRSDKPLVKVSCAILSREIFESELFGHEKGAFTGAQKARQGRFEMADGGTLYLDDIDDIPLDLQVKLLRVLQEREVERVGGNQTIKIDVRVIASTKADLKKLAGEGKFREDLYYRLNVFPIHIPPLRERPDDIPKLVHYYAQQFSPEKEIRFVPEALHCLQAYHWPGNVRELKNILERLILLCREQGCVTLQQIPAEILQPTISESLLTPGQKPLDELLADIEKKLLMRALQITSGSQVKAAELLGIPPSTLRTKISKYELH